ncbi:twitching motility protein PilT [Natronocella acetinitrilica]|uniref:Twitching motility protein PilT n=1 Tax=Natronocella acetinitrilica TaxID=414046 RepID=A0AAE3G5K1_9GAMM|nr:ATPase, T2SS/T4P/T4SS family [Natronocella acetinitrilica]MCP1674262.1 twitching motility protein PilT [Natronocella acetinitrilica]
MVLLPEEDAVEAPTVAPDAAGSEMPGVLPSFTDLYLPEDRPLDGYLFPGQLPIPPSMHGFVEAIGTAIERQGLAEFTDFALEVGGVKLRGCRMPTMAGDFLIFRRMPERIWTLRECGFSSRMRDEMLSERLRQGGLVVVSGLPGNGKSTSCAALLVGRLEAFGGICLTIEDPVEMPLQGRHGDGLCLQRNVRQQEDFALAVRDTMRGYPAKSDSIMLIGEVRDPRTAALALRASVDGRLVILTLHAGDLVQAVQRMLVLAGKELGVGEARNLMASSIRMVLHQRITTPGEGAQAEQAAEADISPPARPRLRYAALLDTDKAASTIRSKSAPLELLRDEIRLQQSAFRRQAPLALRKIG